VALVGGGLSLPFLREALLAHLARFPSTANGLNAVETEIMRDLLDGPVSFGDLLESVGSGSMRRLGLGDVQVAAELARMSGGRAALVKIEPFRTSNIKTVDAEDLEGRRIEATGLGRAVLEGRHDWIAINGIDRWVGGVHLHGRRDIWRWDTETGELVVK
jgi:hypothetical protein